MGFTAFDENHGFRDFLLSLLITLNLTSVDEWGEVEKKNPCG